MGCSESKYIEPIKADLSFPQKFQGYLSYKN